MAALTFHPAQFVEEQQQLALHARERQLHQTVGVDIDQMCARVGPRLVLFLLQDISGRGRRGICRAHREAQEPRVPGVVGIGAAAVVHRDGRRQRRRRRRRDCPVSGNGGRRRVVGSRGRVRRDNVGGRETRRRGQQQ